MPAGTVLDWDYNLNVEAIAKFDQVTVGYQERRQIKDAVSMLAWATGKWWGYTALGKLGGGQ